MNRQNLLWAIWGGVVLSAVLILLQAYVFPVTTSCEMSFTRQTLNNPAWAKLYWENIAKEHEAKLK